MSGSLKFEKRTDSASTAIRSRGVSYRFRGRPAVDDLDLDVPRGIVYGFLGPNGAGKTTTLRLLLGLLRPESGEIEVLGRDLREERSEILRRVGALVDTPALYAHLTGRENLELSRRLRDLPGSATHRALALVGLEGAADRLVRGYSSGMRQRLGIALAILGSPDLLILDEPTNALDPAGIYEIRVLVRELVDNHGATVLLSSHLLSEVEEVADRVGILHRGRLRFQGEIKDLRGSGTAHDFEVDDIERASRIIANAGFVVCSTKVGVRAAHTSRDDAATINHILCTAGVRVYGSARRLPTLEDIFLELTRTP